RIGSWCESILRTNCFGSISFEIESIGCALNTVFTENQEAGNGAGAFSKASSISLAYGIDCAPSRECFELPKITESREEIEEDECSRRPATYENVKKKSQNRSKLATSNQRECEKKNAKLFEKNSRLSSRMISETAKADKDTVLVNFAGGFRLENVCAKNGAK
ncbi:hypothetical protein CEXT_471771, partial [Caerostris extrusa]